MEVGIEFVPDRTVRVVRHGGEDFYCLVVICDDLQYHMTYYSKSHELPVLVFVTEVMVVGGQVGDVDCGNAGERDYACWHLS